MTKAQEVRFERLKKNGGLTAEAEKIFSWILNLMSEDTSEGYFGSLNLILKSDTTRIRKIQMWVNADETYDATAAIIKYGVYALFEELEAIVSREDGFEGKLIPHAIYDDEACIMFKVVIK